MTEHTYPLELLRAELKSAMAEQLVQLVDRFASKQDLAAFRLDFVQHQRDDDLRFEEIKRKLDQLLDEKNRRDGAATERRSFLDSRRFWIATTAVLLGGLASAILVAVFH